jgi:hypothetical protein
MNRKGEFMKKNVGNTDRIVRLILGVVLLVVALLPYIGGSSFMGSDIAQLLVFGILGVIAIMTGLLNHCGIYRLFGMSTCKVKQ